MFVENDGGRPTPTGGAHEGVVSMVRFFLPRHDRICPSYRTSGKMVFFTQVGEAVFFFQMTTMVPIEPEMMMMATKDGRTGKRW